MSTEEQELYQYELQRKDSEIERLNAQVAMFESNNALMRDAIGRMTAYTADAEYQKETNRILNAAYGVTSKYNYLVKRDQQIKDQIVAVADAERLRIANLYQSKSDNYTSDMTSNSDWMRLEGAVAVVQAIRNMKG